MTMSRPRHPRLLGGALALSAIALTLVACELPRPTEVAPVAELPLASIRSETGFEPGERVSVERVRELLLAQRPELLYSRSGRQRLFYVIADARDSVVELQVQEGNRLGKGVESISVDPDRIASIEILKLRPGQLLPDSTGVIWLRLKAEGVEAVHGETAASPAKRATIVLGENREASTPERSVADTMTIVAPGAGTRARLAMSGQRVSIGTDTTTILRGSMSTEAPPLVIIDGVVVAQANLQALDPLRIDRVEVVKGSVATRIYGERGANGVIVVTTKQNP